jgi:hypothetical protein
MRAHLGCQAALPEAALLRHWVLDDLGLSYQHVHQVTARHQVKQEVQVERVLRASRGATRRQDSFSCQHNITLYTACLQLAMISEKALELRLLSQFLLVCLQFAVLHKLRCRQPALQLTLKLAYCLMQKALVVFLEMCCSQ